MASKSLHNLTTNPIPLDTTHSAVTGCSYAGKMAMWGGALDERIALSIAQENGGGGAPSWRVSHEVQVQGSVEQINDTTTAGSGHRCINLTAKVFTKCRRTIFS